MLSIATKSCMGTRLYILPHLFLSAQRLVILSEVFAHFANTQSKDLHLFVQGRMIV